MRSLKILITFLALATTFDTLKAQFHYNKLADDAGFEFQKTVEWFTHPRYNRVEGFFAHGGLTFRPQKLEGFQTQIEAGWGFSNESGKELRFRAGARKDFFDFNRLGVGVDVFREIGSKDEWLISEVENSLFSLLFREDYRDYYGAHGARLYVDKKFKETHTARLELSRRTFDSVQKNLNWSLFGGSFQENPATGSPIQEGDEIGLRLITEFDWRDNPVFPLNGWHLTAIYEKTFDDFETDGFFVTLKRFQQTWGNQRLLLRGIGGTRSGSIAHQYTLDIGGVGTLRGFDDKEFSGNRMFMLNANYLFGGDVLQKVPLQNIPFFGTLWTTLSLGAFFDVGWIGLTNPDDSFLSGFSTKFKSGADAGLSFMVLEGVFRVDFARRLESTDGKDDYRITFRLLETF